MKKYTDATSMPFGKHKGISLEEVPASYLLWWYGTSPASNAFPELQEYIKSRLKILEQEVMEATALSDYDPYNG